MNCTLDVMFSLKFMRSAANVGIGRISNEFHTKRDLFHQKTIDRYVCIQFQYLTDFIAHSYPILIFLLLISERNI